MILVGKDEAVPAMQSMVERSKPVIWTLPKIPIINKFNINVSILSTNQIKLIRINITLYFSQKTEKDELKKNPIPIFIELSDSRLEGGE
jgi:hypothetical protein